MTIFQAALLGLIEGLTEFIPVSSTGHMLVAQRVWGIQANDSTFAFLVLVQLGPLAALLAYFWKEVWSLTRAILDRPFATPQNRLAWQVVLASAPALLVGVLLKDVVQASFQNPLEEAAIRFLTAAALLMIAEWFGPRTRGLDSLSMLDALVVGLFQVAAVFPGASRSGSAISGGMLRRLDRAAATRFAFLLSAPIMLAAGGFESLSVLRHGVPAPMLASLLVGNAVAGVVGWLSIRWLIGYVSGHSLRGFGIYCALIGAACLAALWL